jgi:hypothetical protein
MVSNDDPSGGLDAGTGFAQQEGGLTLAQTGSGGCGVGPVVVPSPQTIVVDNIAAFHTTPANLSFTATCGAGGATIAQPSWTISDYEIATIDNAGAFTVYSPVAKTETVTATTAVGSAAGSAIVQVNVSEFGAGVSNATKTAFTTAGRTPGTTDPNLRTLYPYRHTVFPLGLGAPLVQWDTKETPASSVKVSLRYPRAPTAPQFTWSIILNGEPDGPVISGPYTHAPAYAIPQYVWAGFDRTAAGLVDQAEIAIQRMVGGTVRNEVTIPVSFATSPLNGTVYYTQYQRTVTNASAVDSRVTDITMPYAIGNVCPQGNGTHIGEGGTSAGSQLEQVNLGAGGVLADPWGGTAGCPVCHSISADGKTMLGGDSMLSSFAGGTALIGLNKIGAGGVFTQKANAPDWLSTDDPWNSRGFAYNAITPDGRYNLQNRFSWGNTVDLPPAAGILTLKNNATGDAWKVWDNSSGTPTDVSASFTGLKPGGTPVTMMTPAFSPDGTKLVYVNGDGGPGNATGWRKGISVMPFNQATKTFSASVLVRNNWAGGAGTGNAMKWPFFEHDSKSILFVETDPNAWCAHSAPPINDVGDVSSPCYCGSYGSMSPTTRSIWPGRILSMDSSIPLSAAADLTTLNNGEGPADASKSYQPTVLPYAAGGYRWAVFTSMRPYGNQVNPYNYIAGKATAPTCNVAQIWIGALTDTTSSGTTDRSYPPFWMPNQRYARIDSTTNNHYLNEHGYLVASPCKANGSGAASACNLNSDCCNATCRIDLPAARPPTRHCAAPSGSCSNPGQSCSVNGDCCTGTQCINGSCSALPTYPPATYSRDYVAVCPMAGTHAVWHLFQWHASVPGNANITFTVQTGSGADGGAFLPATPALIGTATNANQNPPPAAVDVSLDVDTVLKSNVVTGGPVLRIFMAFNSTTPGNLSTPILYDWSQSFDCVAAE